MTDLTGRARIRDAAIEAFGRQGFERTRVRDVALAANVSPALVLHHFGSKEGLRQACDEFVTGELFARKDKLQSGGVAGEIQSWLRDVDRYRPQLAYIARMLSGDTEASRALFTELVSGTRQMIDTQVEAGVMRDIPDRDVLATYLAAWGIAPLLLEHHLAAALGSPEDPGAVYRRSTIPLMELLTHGVYADDRLLRAAREALGS